MAYSINSITDSCYEGTTFDLSVADIDLFMVATIHAAQAIMDDLISFFDTMLIDPNLNLDYHLSL